MNKKRNAIIKLPQIKDRGGDLTKNWYVEYQVRDPKNGNMVLKRMSKGINNHNCPIKRKKVAEEIKAELTRKLRAGWNPLNDGETYIYEDDLEYKEIGFQYRKARKSNRNFRYCTQAYLKKLYRELNPDTVSGYVSKIRTFAKWLDYKKYGEFDISEISNKIVVDFFEHLIDERKISSNTLRKYKNILTGLFDYLNDQKIVRINPMYGLPQTSVINEEPIWPIRKGDIQAFKEELKKDRWLWLAILFEYYCALRPGKEVRLIKIKDIDFYEGTINVNINRAKGNVKRIIQIPEVFLDILINDYKLNTYPRELFVFSRQDGKYGPGDSVIGKNNMRARFQRIRDKLGMPYEYKFYSWKHTGAMAMLKGGADLMEISNHLGHRDKQSTEHYIKNTFGEQSEFVKHKFPKI